MDSAKVEKNIQDVEDKLRALLIPASKSAAESGATIFINEDFNPYNLNQFDVIAENALSLARESLNLHECIGLDPSESAASLYIAACQELADTANEHRRGPRKLAQWVHQQLVSAHAM